MVEAGLSPGLLSAKVPVLSTTLHCFQNQILSLLLRSAAMGGLMVELRIELKRHCLNTWYFSGGQACQGSRVEGFGRLGAAWGLWARTLSGKGDKDKRGQGHGIFVLGASSVKWGSWFIYSNRYQPYPVSYHPGNLPSLLARKCHRIHPPFGVFHVHLSFRILLEAR